VLPTIHWVDLEVQAGASDLELIIKKGNRVHGNLVLAENLDYSLIKVRLGARQRWLESDRSFQFNEFLPGVYDFRVFTTDKPCGNWMDWRSSTDPISALLSCRSSICVIKYANGKFILLTPITVNQIKIEYGGFVPVELSWPFHGQPIQLRKVQK
jgi:hypothetical protein